MLSDSPKIFDVDALSEGTKQEVLNERALFVFNRVQQKLTGA
jgi:hypothetical protein